MNSVIPDNSVGAPPDAQSDPDPSWASVPRTFRSLDGSLPQPWESMFGPLRHGGIDDLVVVAQCGQSIDGRVATPAGHSHYINGAAGLAHLHRLRALVDAVVIGVGTAIADDPQLTVRRVAGPSPARVILDPNGRLPLTARVLAPDGIRRLVVTAKTRRDLPADVEILPLNSADGNIAPTTILSALAERGMRHILVEGGANTISRFLTARCLDRLHVVVAPIMLGSGPSSIALAPIERVAQAVPAPIRAHILGEEVLLDCDLSGQRLPVVGEAKISM